MALEAVGAGPHFVAKHSVQNLRNHFAAIGRPALLSGQCRPDSVGCINRPRSS